MLYYFSLQFRLVNRHLKDFGLQPAVGYILAYLTFTGLSVFLFMRTEFAGYIYAAIALSFTGRLSESARNRFLKSCFSARDFYRIRVLENMLVVLPFAVFLLFQSLFLVSAFLLFSSVLMVFINFNQTLNFTIPTPFYKKPFEFTTGFRNTFFLIIFAYFLTIMSVTTGNFNLGIFALILVLFICMSYYTNSETGYYVWIFSLSPGKFLWHKIRIAYSYASMLCLPVCLALSVFFPSNAAAIAGFISLGYLYMVVVILAKYSAFPDKINLPQFLIIAFCISFPPLLLGVIPNFYSKSINSLRNIQHDKN